MGLGRGDIRRRLADRPKSTPSSARARPFTPSGAKRAVREAGAGGEGGRGRAGGEGGGGEGGACVRIYYVRRRRTKRLSQTSPDDRNKPPNPSPSPHTQRVLLWLAACTRRVLDEWPLLRQERQILSMMIGRDSSFPSSAGAGGRGDPRERQRGGGGAAAAAGKPLVRV